MNHVTVSGKIQGQVFRSQVGGKTKTDFRLAVQQGMNKDGSFKPTVWMSVVTWDPMTSGPGDELLVSGRLARDEWTDKSGESKGKDYIAASKIALLASGPRCSSNIKMAYPPESPGPPSRGPEGSPREDPGDVPF